MATFIPSLNSCIGKMQAGERRFARRLASHLEDDYLCWYEVPVGERHKYADFIVLHPNRGVLLLEVKDWKLDTIRVMDKRSATILTSNGLKSVNNPLEQVRDCAYRLIDRLEGDAQLVHVDGRYKGNLVFPYGYGVVLTSISRQQFLSTGLGEVLPEHQTICKDEMVESMDSEAFQQRLWDMFNFQFRTPLTLPQIDRIRWHLFPEVRIDAGEQLELIDDAEDEQGVDQLLPDIVRVMDMQQELLARSLGEGHRVIHGVAGSGKTLILGYRCLHLARMLNKPILVLCYNITLAARLRELMRERGVDDKVNVYHFHDWCGEQLRLYHVARPAQGERYFDRLVDAVIAATDRGDIPRAQYGAVMIDEGHDFEPEWLQLVVSMVDPQTNSLLLLYDDAQSIYKKASRLDFSLSSVGVQARGRTTVLKLNYRNTEEILAFAFRFASRYIEVDDKDGEHAPLVEPEAVGRHGPPPVIRVFDAYESEASYIARTFLRLHDERGLPWSDMCVAYRSGWMGEHLESAFSRLQIPVRRLSNAREKRRFSLAEDKVKLMTMHSSKGLEFPLVAVSGVGRMPVDTDDAVGEAKLLYVALTRSTDKLLVTADREAEFVSELLAASAGAGDGR